MATLSIRLRPSSKGAAFPGSLYFRIIHRRKIVTITTPYHLYGAEWNYEHQKIPLPPDDNADNQRTLYLRQTNESLLRDCEYLRMRICELERSGVYTARDILAGFHYRHSQCMLKDFATEKARELFYLGRERTSEAYLSAMRCLIRFHDGRDIPLSDIDSILMQRFEAWLKATDKSLNTISFYMRNLRAIYNRAVQAGLIDPPKVNPFAQVYTGVQITRKRALSKKEIHRLDNLDLLTENPSRLRLALDIFLFCFHARGMSFVDVAYLKKPTSARELSPTSGGKRAGCSK